MTRTGHVDSYYAATANDATRDPALAGAARADICVVGGGYAGLSAALELAVRGYDVVLLEAERVGWGASGRNGGQVATGFAADMGKIARWVGADAARQLWRMTEEAKAIIRERVERYDIRCDLKPGYLYAALKPRQLADLAAEADLLGGTYGYDQIELLDAGRVRGEVDSAIYVGGLLDRGGAHLHPLNYALGLARAARAEGVRIHADSAVVRFEKRDGRHRVVTRGGHVDSDLVVFCANAYQGELVPALRRKIMPVGTYIIATERLDEARARILIPNDIAVADVKFVLDYFRLSADRRLLFGGKVSYTTLPPPGLKESMRRAMLTVFPQLRDAAIDYVWGGNVAITAERTPHLGRLEPGFYFAQGFSGHGVAMTGIAGRVIAGAVDGDASRLDLFARLPHQRFVGGRLLRTPILALAMLYYRVRDLL